MSLRALAPAWPPTTTTSTTSAPWSTGWGTPAGSRTRDVDCKYSVADVLRERWRQEHQKNVKSHLAPSPVPLPRPQARTSSGTATSPAGTAASTPSCGAPCSCCTARRRWAALCAEWDSSCFQLRKNTNLLLNEKNSLVRKAKEKTERELDCRIFTLTKQKQKLQVNKTKSVTLKNLLLHNIIY